MGTRRCRHKKKKIRIKKTPPVGVRSLFPALSNRPAGGSASDGQEDKLLLVSTPGATLLIKEVDNAYA